MFDTNTDPLTNASSSLYPRIHPDKYAFNIGTHGARQYGNGERGFAVAFLLLFFGGGLLLLIAMATLLNEDAQLNQNGAMIRAQVIKAEIDDDSDGDRYFITYQFYAESGPFEGQQFIKQVRVPRNLYNQMNTVGAPVQVQYDANNPNASDVVAADRTTGYRIGVMVGASFILIVAAITWWWLNTDRRQRVYRTRGKLLPAEVITHEKVTDSDGGHQVNLKYRFVTPSGKQIERTESTNDAYWKEASPLAAGAQFQVIYVDDRNFRVL